MQKPIYKIWSKDCPFIFDGVSLTRHPYPPYDYIIHTSNGWVMHDKDLGNITNLWGLICLPRWCSISIDAYFYGKSISDYRFPIDSKHFLATYSPSDFDLTKLHDVNVIPDTPALCIRTMKDVKEYDEYIIKELGSVKSPKRAHFLIHDTADLFNYRDPYLRKMLAKSFPQYVKYTDELDDYKYSK